MPIWDFHVSDCSRSCSYGSTGQGERPLVRIVLSGRFLRPCLCCGCHGLPPLCCWGFLDEEWAAEVCLLHGRPVRAEHRLFW